jgi:uncharacterized protein YihD (DUF1040 family)
MRDPKRIDKIINKLRAVWKTNPDLRLGQLIHNIAHDAVGNGVDIFFVEDDLMEKALDVISKGTKAGII